MTIKSPKSHKSQGLRRRAWSAKRAAEAARARGATWEAALHAARAADYEQAAQLEEQLERDVAFAFSESDSAGFSDADLDECLGPVAFGVH